MEPPSKRQKYNKSPTSVDASSIRAKRSAFLDSLERGISPPSIDISILGDRNHETAKKPLSSAKVAPVRPDDVGKPLSAVATEPKAEEAKNIRYISSPIQLSRIENLPSADNVDTVGLSDILGDPLIKEAWIFNFCFDVDWTMQHFDQDVRQLVKVKIVHGSWRREDMNKIGIDDACTRWPNVEAIQAYLPDAFGTHHSKMFILLRHDDTAQVVIHTANMLAKDWGNMTQAIWKSPCLPLLPAHAQRAANKTEELAIGTGERFKVDLIRYLKAYGNKLKSLTDELARFDFSAVRGALVASVPSKFDLSDNDEKVWGYEMLRRALKNIPCSSSDPHFVYQVSSIASLPASWLNETLYKSMHATAATTSIIFPTPIDVANSLDGYAAGGSIHMKAQKDVHLKQISALRSQLCRWTESGTLHAKRHLAAPHIKTYIRFVSKPSPTAPAPEIDWVLVTSANLSTQAWGSSLQAATGGKRAEKSQIKIQSFEIGVLVWPALYGEEHDKVRMVPAFQRDHVTSTSVEADVIVAFRMPYDLPLTSYQSSDRPWSPQSSHTKADRHGRKWVVD